MAGPWGSLASQPGLLGKVQSSEGPCLKKQGGQLLMNNTWDCPRVGTHTYRQTDTHTHSYKQKQSLEGYTQEAA